MDNKKWYQKNGGIILMLILFFPVGIFLMWRYSKWSNVAKIIVTAFFVLVLISGVGSERTDAPENIAEDPVVVSDEEVESLTEITTITEKHTTDNEETTIANTTAQEVTTTQKDETTEEVTTTQEQTTIQESETTEEISSSECEVVTEEEVSVMVWIPNSGQKYHSNSGCSGMENPSYVTKDYAEECGFTPCGRCY